MFRRFVKTEKRRRFSAAALLPSPRIFSRPIRPSARAPSTRAVGIAAESNVPRAANNFARSACIGRDRIHCLARVVASSERVGPAGLAKNCIDAILRRDSRGIYGTETARFSDDAMQNSCDSIAETRTDLSSATVNIPADISGKVRGKRSGDGWLVKRDRRAKRDATYR